MDQHSHHVHHAEDGHGHGPGRHGEAGLADLLDLDAEMLAPLLDEVVTWAAELAPQNVHTIVDVGAGTGTGSLALARRFDRARLVALDRSPAMLERLRTAATAEGMAGRLLPVECDLDVAWPPIGAVDLAWASSSLHEVADPDRLLGDIHASLDPGGLLTVVEIGALPRFLSDDAGPGRPGLEARCHAALAQAGWNDYPDWGPHLEAAGFDVLAQRTFSLQADPAPPATGRYAQTFLRRVRSALDGRLAADDLEALDRLLADDGTQSVLRRRDLTLRASRTAWAARRPS